MIQIARGQNRQVDSLAILASSLIEEVPRLIKVEVVKEPSIDVKANVSNVRVSEPCWMDPIIDFLVEDHVPNNEKEAKRICGTAARYWLFEDQRLYQRSFGGLYLLCLHPNKVEELLTELHKRACSSHVGGRSLAYRVMT